MIHPFILLRQTPGRSGDCTVTDKFKLHVSVAVWQ
jgi:hypothetical protein